MTVHLSKANKVIRPLLSLLVVMQRYGVVNMKLEAPIKSKLILSEQSLCEYFLGLSNCTEMCRQSAERVSQSHEFEL